MRLRLDFSRLAFVGLLLALWLSAPAQAAPKVGAAMPLFELPLLADTHPEPATVNLAELLHPKLGSEPKAMLVVFFASYCQPCRDEFPEWRRLFKTYSEQGLALLMVDADYEESGIKTARDFVATQTPAFLVLSDRLALVSKRYFGEDPTLPSAFLADSSGKLAGIYLGKQSVPAVIETDIKSLLAKTPTLLAAGNKRSDENQSLMVWRLERKSDAIKDAEIDSLSGIVIAEAGHISGRSVVSEYDVRTMLKKEEAVQRCGSAGTTRSCMLEIGGAMNLPDAVSGDLGHIGNGWVFNLRYTSLRGEGGGRASRQIEGTLDDVMDVIPGMVAEIFGKPAPLLPATVVVTSQPKGALVSEGQNKLGATPLRKRLPPGEHELTLRAPGYLPAVRKVSAASGGRQELEITLTPRPMSKFTIAAHASFWPGLTLAGLGGIFIWQAKAKSDERYSDLKAGRFPAAKSAYTASKAFAATGITSLALGGAAMISGIILWAIAPSQAEKEEAKLISVIPGAEGVSLVARGRF